MMRAKLKWFFRRSLLRYAIATALVTYGMHGINASLQPRGMAVRGLVYFAILCFAVLVLLVMTAWMQSRRITPRTVTFTEDSVVVDFKGESVNRGWDWIIAAEESPTLISLLVQKLPRLELYLHKASLDDDEYRTLHEWRVLHGKYG
jgi:hypothetical protein